MFEKKEKRKLSEEEVAYLTAEDLTQRISARLSAGEPYEDLLPSWFNQAQEVYLKRLEKAREDLIASNLYVTIALPRSLCTPGEVVYSALTQHIWEEEK